MRAYTLIEVVVTLLLSTIIIGIAISGYFMINNQFKLFDTMTNESIDVLRFHNFLKSDFINTAVLEIEKNQLDCVINGTKIKYTFNENSIVRTQLLESPKTDSLSLPSLQLIASFQEEQKDFGIIDKVILKCDLYGQKQEFIYSKNYSATELIKYD